MKILIVEDDAQTAEFLHSALSEPGWKVVVAEEGRGGLAQALAGEFDVAVIDRMLPGLDGLSLVRTLREAGSALPALFLTTMSGIDDRVDGLQAGGDDYLLKPFAVVELIARVRALARRPQLGRSDMRQSVADLELDRLARRVTRDGRTIDLQPREYQLLDFLMRNAGNVVTRHQLLESVWDFHFDPQTNIVETHISRLRSKIDRGFERSLIVTVRGSGYVLRDPAA